MASLLTPPVPEHWMAQAFELACSAGRRDEIPVGALLVRDQQIIGAGTNCREQTSRTIAHAEVLAIEDFNKRSGQWRVPTGCSLYVTVEPCLMCTGALLWARVEKIYFGCADPKNAGLRKLLPFINSGVYDHRFSLIAGGILKERCSSLLSGYFKKKRQQAKDAEFTAVN